MSPIKLKSHRPFTAVLAASLAILGLCACGSTGNGGTTVTQADSGSATNPVVARVGGLSISRGTLSHWMATIIGGDYDENIRRPAPRGLVSDPPDYPRCVAAIETLGPPKDSSESSALIHTHLVDDCHELYQDLKEQALAYLIQGLWNIEEGKGDGISVTQAQIEQAFKKYEAERFPSEAAFTSFLANREWSLSDDLYLIKRDILDQRLGAARERAARKKAHSRLEVQRGVLELYAQSLVKWKPRTTCSPGYVIPECRQSTGPATTGAPDALLEQIAASR